MRLALLLLLAGSIGLVGSAQARPSTFSRSRGGAKALYMLLDDLGYRPARVFNVGELDGKEHVLALLGQASDNEEEQLLKQVRKGGLLILALPLFDEGGYCDDTRFGSFKIKRQLRSGWQQRKTRHPELKIRASVCEMRVPDGGRLLAGTEKGAVAMELAAGQGKLLVLAHEDLLVHLNLNRDDLVVLVRRWLSDNAPARGRVVFLENRTGGGGGASVVSMLRKAGLSIFLLHGLIFLLLLYWSQTPRFGDPTEVFVQTRREFSQHAHALGHLYQHRRASVHALRQQYERFLDWLVGKPEMAMAGIGAVQRRALRGNRGAIAALIATRTGRDPASVESLLAQIEYTVGSSGPSDARDVQRHYRLGQALAALQHSTGAAQRGTGDKRGRSKIH